MNIERLKVNNKKYDDVKLIYSHKSMQTLLTWMESTHSQSLEFGFMGIIEREGNTFRVSDFYLMRNTVTNAAYWESDAQAMAEFFNEFPVKDRCKIRIFGHSHVRMGTSPSGTDDKQLYEFMDLVNDYMIQLIINRDMKNTVHIYNKEEGLIFKNVPQFVELENGKLICFNSLDSCKLDSTIVIQDGNYEIKNGQLEIEDDVVFDLKTNKFTVGKNNCFIYYENGKLCSKISSMSKEEKDSLLKEVNDLFKEKMPKPKAIENRYGSAANYYRNYYGYNNSNHPSNYDEDDDFTNFWKDWDSKYSAKKEDPITENSVEDALNASKHSETKSKWWQLGGKKNESK